MIAGITVLAAAPRGAAALEMQALVEEVFFLLRRFVRWI
jgi:hypothetical protein